MCKTSCWATTACCAAERESCRAARAGRAVDRWRPPLTARARLPSLAQLEKLASRLEHVKGCGHLSRKAMQGAVGGAAFPPPPARPVVLRSRGLWTPCQPLINSQTPRTATCPRRSRPRLRSQRSNTRLVWDLGGRLPCRPMQGPGRHRRRGKVPNITGRLHAGPTHQRWQSWRPLGRPGKEFIEQDRSAGVAAADAAVSPSPCALRTGLQGQRAGRQLQHGRACKLDAGANLLLGKSCGAPRGESSACRSSFLS